MKKLLFALLAAALFAATGAYADAILTTANGQIRIRDYDSQEALLKRHSQIGVDDCSTDLELRGLPVCRGLIISGGVRPLNAQRPTAS